MKRRDFLKVVGIGATMIVVQPSMIGQKLYASDGSMFKTYDKVQLMDAQGDPVLASNLEKEKNYVFNYPHVATPCFLLALPEKISKDIKLKSEDGEEYIWSGGVGKENNIVAYTAICSHQLTHVNPADSFISYVPKKQKTIAYTEGGVIVCGTHLAAFDPAKGAKALSGPTSEPLASIVLEHHDDDTLWAVAVLGPDKFHSFFKAFKPEFKAYFGGKRKAKKFVTASAQTVLLTEYTKEIVQY